MTFPTYFNPKKTGNLFGLIDKFIFLKNLYIKKKLPKVLMLSGHKGLGKSTLLNHFLFFVFDEKNYDIKKNSFNPNSNFYNQFLNNIFPNIIYISGSTFKNVKIDDIRDLKKNIYQSSITDKPRFIIFDDIEIFNHNSLNGLLKILEEPTKNNYFILINNKAKPLIETIKSRALEIKMILGEENRYNIILSLIETFKISPILDPKTSQLSPGHFIKFNYIYDVNKISTEENFIKQLGILLNLYKKEKDIMFIDMISFLTENYFSKAQTKKIFTNEKVIEYKRFVLENINKFFLYNLNQNALLNNISNKINAE